MSVEPTIAPDRGMRPIAEMGNRTKFIVMAGTMLGLFTAAMDQTVVSTSMPRIIADLSGFGLFSWVGTGFLLASTCTVAVVGRLTDIYGRKPFYMSGILILMIGRLIESWSHANVDMSFGRLGERLLVGPRFHRLHHALAGPEERERLVKDSRH